MSTKQKKLLGHVFCHSIKDIQKSPLSVFTEHIPFGQSYSKIFNKARYFLNSTHFV